MAREGNRGGGGGRDRDRDRDRDGGSRRGGAGRVRDRSPDGRRENRRNDRMTRSPRSPTDSAEPTPLSTSIAPDYHFHVRRAVRACVDDNDFQNALSPDGSVRLGVEDVLEAMCAACDRVAQALPTEAPLDFDALASSAKEILASNPKCGPENVAAASRFTVVFIQRVRQFLQKVEPPPQPPARKERLGGRGGERKEEKPSEGGADGEKSEKKHRSERNSNSNNNTNNRASPVLDSVLGDAPPPLNASVLGGAVLPPPPTHGGALFMPPPMPMPMPMPVGGRGVLDPPNFQQQGYNNGNFAAGGPIIGGYPHPQQHQHQHYNNSMQHGRHYQNNNNNTNYNNNNRASNTYGDTQQGAGSGAPQNAFVFKPAPDIGTRYVTMRNIPPHMATKDALKGALETIINGLKGPHYANAFFLNFNVFQNDLVNEGDTPTYFAVVSFNTSFAASEVADRINKMASSDASSVTAEGSSAEEIGLFWGEARDKLEALEMEILGQFAAMDAARSTAVEIETRLAALLEETRVADAAIREKQSDPAKREELKEALRSRLALNKERDELLEKRRVNNESAGLLDPSSNALALPERFSSSSAAPTNARNLFYLTDISVPLNDDKVLILLNRLEIKVLHIWRDEASTMICVEMPIFGAVVGAMRKLDFLDGTFANVRFTNEKPRKPQQVVQ